MKEFTISKIEMLILRIRVDKPKGLQRFCFAWFALRFGVLYKKRQNDNAKR
nr:MAG TPA: hypothetical protein [Caudoviricetes sp.]